MLFAALNMPANLENSTVTIGLEKVSFHSNPKERQCKECSNYLTIALISHTSKVILKILQARFQQYVNHELPDVQAGFRKARGTRDQIANIPWIIEKAIEFQKNIYFCIVDYTKAFDCVDHNKLWKILKEMGIPDHLMCLLRNLCAGQEATVRTGHKTTYWLQIGKGGSQGCILLPCIQISQEAGKAVWYSHLFKNFPEFVVIHTGKGFDMVNKAEIDVFLDLSFFFEDPTDVGNLISDSSAFSKSSLNIWEFTVEA